MLSSSEQSLVEHCLAALEKLPGLEARYAPSNAEPHQGELHLKGPWGEATFHMRLLTRLSPEGLQLVQIHQKTAKAPLLILCPHVGTRQAETLKELGLHFLDASGNGWLSHPPLYLEVSGRRPQKISQRPGRAFTPAGLKLIYLLLQNPLKARAPFRQLAQEAGIALGAVSGIMQELKNQNYLEQRGSRRRDLLRGEALLYRWQLGYLEQLRPRLLVQTCRPTADQPLTQIARQLGQSGSHDGPLLGGELGAGVLENGGESSQISLHVRKEDVLRLMLQLQLTPDPEGPISLLQTFGTHNRWTGWQPEGATLADPLLLFSEMAAHNQGHSPLAANLLQRQILPRINA